MILRTELVEQQIDSDRSGHFVKEVLMTKGDTPLGLVRKRSTTHTKDTRGAVLLVHGFGQNRYTFHTSKRSMSAYLAEEGFDVFNLDLRGHGRSRRFGAGRSSTLDEYIREDLPKALEEVRIRSGHAKIWLVGHSMGGLISYGVSGMLREQVHGVVSIGSPYRFGQGSSILQLLALTVESLGFTGILDGNPPLPLRVVGRHFRKRRALWDLRSLPIPVRSWHPGSIEAPILDEYLERAFDLTSVGVAMSIVRSGREAAMKSLDGQTDYGLAFEHSPLPLLVIAGSHDSLAPPQSVRPAYERSNAKDKTYREFPFGHIDLIVGREAPQTVWPLINTWIGTR